MSRLVVLATRNEHKAAELRAILAGALAELDLEIRTVAAYPDVPEVPETEVTFAGNAALKARIVATTTGLPALADDSGLAVDVLGGCPGVFSARWSGTRAGPGATRAAIDRANLELLLEQLGDVPDEHRSAAFVCAAALALPGGPTATAVGRVDGRLVRAPRGDNGFGYDPIFVPDNSERTFAEHTDAEKNALSHRGRAFRALVSQLRRLLGPAAAPDAPTRAGR